MLSVVAFVVVLVGLVGCSTVQSKLEVMGFYELNTKSPKITLDVLPNGTFVEVVMFSPERVEKRVGKWHWAYERLNFDDLWVPDSVAPDYIRRADSSADKGRPKYTDPGHWSIKAEKHWGTVILPIFPDADINFTMVRRTARELLANCANCSA